MLKIILEIIERWLDALDHNGLLSGEKFRCLLLHVMYFLIIKSVGALHSAKINMVYCEGFLNLMKEIALDLMLRYSREDIGSNSDLNLYESLCILSHLFYIHIFIYMFLNWNYLSTYFYDLLFFLYQLFELLIIFTMLNSILSLILYNFLKKHLFTPI